MTREWKTVGRLAELLPRLPRVLDELKQLQFDEVVVQLLCKKVLMQKVSRLAPGDLAAIRAKARQDDDGSPVCARRVVQVLAAELGVRTNDVLPVDSLKRKRDEGGSPQVPQRELPTPPRHVKRQVRSGRAQPTVMSREAVMAAAAVASAARAESQTLAREIPMTPEQLLLGLPNDWPKVIPDHIPFMPDMDSEQQHHDTLHHHHGQMGPIGHAHPHAHHHLLQHHPHAHPHAPPHPHAHDHHLILANDHHIMYSPPHVVAASQAAEAAAGFSLDADGAGADDDGGEPDQGDGQQ